jgi:hypothetical protein
MTSAGTPDPSELRQARITRRTTVAVQADIARRYYPVRHNA